MKDPILEVNNLRVSFRTYNGKVQAVRGIDFKLFEGETLAIVGESGSGKSVTTKAILGILPKNSIIEEGEILYKGDDLTKYKEKDFYKIRGKEISLIFQDPLSALNPIMKIGKQITEALVLREHMTKEQAKKRAIELMGRKDIKLVKRGRIKEYAAQVPGSTYTEGFRGIWTIPCDIALPCATQNEITAAEAEEIVKGGAMAVAEGANMPSTPEAIAIFQKAGLLFAPAKAANAGGVAVSALEMSQNSMRYSWTFEEVDAKLQGIMVNIFHNINNAAKEYGMEGNLVAGANLAGFKKVSEAMIAQRLAVSRECWRRFCP